MYYASVQGRFTSVDPANAASEVSDPQSWNMRHPPVESLAKKNIAIKKRRKRLNHQNQYQPQEIFDSLCCVI